MVESSDKKSDCDGWSKKLLARAEFKVYRKLLSCKKNKVGYDKVPSASEMEAIEPKNKLNYSREDKNILQVAKFNQQAYTELILSIGHMSASHRATFGMVRNCNMSKYPGENCNMVWNRMIVTYAPKMTLSLLKSKICLKIASSKMSQKI